MLLCIVEFGLYRRRRNTLRPSSKEKVFPIFGAAMICGQFLAGFVCNNEAVTMPPQGKHPCWLIKKADFMNQGTGIHSAVKRRV